jgi:beta-lactam-binding protein with PASTA domain
MNRFTQSSVYNFLWLLPFFFFLLGYLSLRFFFTIDSFSMPQLIGLQVHDAVKLLSPYSLTMRIIEEKETTEVPEGTILSQLPLEGQKIKTHQSVRIIVSQKTAAATAPLLTGLSESAAIKKAQEKELDIKLYKLYHAEPTDICIAQLPAANLPLSSRKIIAYISAGSLPYRLMPNCKNRPVEEVTSLLRNYAIEPQIFHGYELEENHSCQNCYVVDQRPFAGTLVDISSPFKVQLRIEQAA